MAILDRFGNPYSGRLLSPFAVPIGFMKNKAAGSSFPTWVSHSGTIEGNAAGFTATLPSSYQANDIIFQVIETQNNQVAVITTANGFVETASSPVTTGGGTHTRLACFWKRAASGSETAMVIGDSGNHQIAMSFAIRGCRTSGNPWDTTVSDHTGTTGDTSVSLAGATPTNANSLVVIIATTDFDAAPGNPQYSGWTNGDLANLTERFDDTHDAGGGGGIAVVTGERAVATAFGTTTATLANSAAHAELLLVLSPT